MLSIVKVIENGYEHPLALRGLLNYIFTDKSTGNCCYYCGGANIDPQNAEEEMRAVKRAYRKTEGRIARHFVVSLGSDSLFLPCEANELALKICQYYSDRYQIVYSVHENTKNLHIHFVMNTVSFRDGLMFSEGPAELQQFKNYVQQLINEQIRKVNHQNVMYGW